MAGGIVLSLGLRRPELRRVSHSARSAEARATASLDRFGADCTGVALRTSQGNGCAVDYRVAIGTDRLAVANLIREIGVGFPGLNVVCMEMIRGAALLASVVVSGENCVTPVLISPGAAPFRRQHTLVDARGQVSALWGAVLHRSPLALLERLAAPLADQHRGGIVFRRTLRRAGNPTVPRVGEEGLVTDRADLGAAGVADELAGMLDSKGVPAFLTVADDVVCDRRMADGAKIRVLAARLVAPANHRGAAGIRAVLRLCAHILIIAHSGALERLSQMGLTPRLAE